MRDGMSRLETVGAAAVATATYTRVPGTSLLNTTTVNNGSTNVLTVDRDYDSLTRLESITSTPSASSAKSFTYVYNDRDQRTTCTLADGSYWVYQYDTLGQVISGIKYDDDDQPIPGCTFGYAFDDIGNRKTATSDLTGTAMYDPNTLNQYESRTVPGIIPVIGTAAADTVVKIHRKALGDGPAAFIVPDRTGNIFHKNIAVDNSNGPVTEELDVYCHKHLTGPPAQEIAAKASRTVTVPKSPETFTYDDDGNLLSDGRFTYTWDAENRLTSVESVSSVSNKTRLEFSYDFQSRRTSKKVYSWDGSAWQLDKTEKFVYDGWNLVAVFNASNELQRSFCWAGLGDLVADTDLIAGKSYLPIYDGNKNIHGYVDATDGSLVSEYDFDPFGRIVQQSGTGDFPFRFASYFRDAETGMIYYGYRYYSPEIGRWMGRDPIEETGGINLYCMAGNNTINLVDLLGLWTEPLRDPEKPRATICSNNDEDSIPNLAEILGFDEIQALGENGWLRDKEGNPLPIGTIVTNGSSYTVPNQVFISLGNVDTLPGPLQANVRRITEAQLHKARKHYKAEGYMVIIPQKILFPDGEILSSSKNEIDQRLDSLDLAIWIHMGHGDDPAGGGIKLDFISQGKRMIRSYRPASFTRNERYKLALVILYSCNAGAGNWWHLVSGNGRLKASPHSVIPYDFWSKNPLGAIDWDEVEEMKRPINQ